MGLFGKKAARAAPYDPEKARLTRNLHEAEARHLEVLRREVANLIVELDPDLMTRCYEKAWAFERDISRSPEQAAAEEAALVAKIPMFEDFDIIGLRHFIPYREAAKMIEDDALIDRYHDLSRMLIFMRKRQEFGTDAPVHNESERDVLYKAMQREKDRRFRERMENAMQRYYTYRSGVEKATPTAFAVTTYADAEVEINHLPSLPDNEYGIEFKKTGELGVYSFHVFDSGKITHTYKRSGPAFTERKSLAI